MTMDIESAVRLQQPAVGSLKRPLALAITCFLVWGFAYGLLDVLNKHFQETLHIGKARSSWLQIAYFGAYLLMSVPAGTLLQAKGYKFSLVTGLAITAVGALLFIPSAQAESFPYFVSSMFVLAAGLCCLETAADTYVNVLGPPERASQRLNLAQSFNALGVFFGPVVGGALFFDPAVASRLGGEQRAVQLTYLIAAFLIVMFAVVLARANLPEASESPGTQVPPVSGPIDAPALWRQRHFVFGVMTQGLYVGAQVGIGAFFLNLVTETWSGLSSRQGAFLLSLATIGYLVGRFASTALLSRVSPRSLLTAYALTNVVLCLLVTAGAQKLSAIALMAVFFFMAPMFATIFTLGVRNLGASTKRGASIMVMAIGGGVLLPYPMGRIADLYGTPAAFLLPAVSFAVVALYGWKGAVALDANSAHCARRSP
jgi:FHS family L-fucose permease-like MFS transporter